MAEVALGHQSKKMKGSLMTPYIVSGIARFRSQEPQSVTI